MTLSFPSNFIPSRTVVLAILLTIQANLKMSVDDDDDDGRPLWNLLTSSHLNPIFWYSSTSLSGFPVEIWIFTFQQENAATDRARKTTALVFILPSVWPPNSHDLNPVDYHMWGILEPWVHCDTSHLKVCMAEERQKFVPEDHWPVT